MLSSAPTKKRFQHLSLEQLEENTKNFEEGLEKSHAPKKAPEAKDAPVSHIPAERAKQLKEVKDFTLDVKAMIKEARQNAPYPEHREDDAQVRLEAREKAIRMVTEKWLQFKDKVTPWFVTWGFSYHHINDVIGATNENPMDPQTREENKRILAEFEQQKAAKIAAEKPEVKGTDTKAIAQVLAGPGLKDKLVSMLTPWKTSAPVEKKPDAPVVVAATVPAPVPGPADAAPKEEPRKSPGMR